MEVGAFTPAAVDLSKFVFLCLAMSCEDFNRVCMGVFDVFSDNGSLPAQDLLTLIAHLGPDMDPEVRVGVARVCPGTGGERGRVVDTSPY